jgi:HEXXH motif-containing protein
MGDVKSTRWWHGFSSALEPFHAGWVEDVAVSAFRRRAHLYLRQFRELLDEHSDGGRATLESFVDGPLSFQTVHHPSMGRMRHAFSFRPPDPREALLAAGMMLLRFVESGWSARFTLALAETPSAPMLTLQDLLLPPARTIAVESDGHEVEIALDGGRPLRITLDHRTGHARRDFGAWTPTRLLRVETGADANSTSLESEHLLLLPAQLVPQFFDGTRAEAPSEAAVARYQAAFALLRDHAPAFFRWTRRVLRTFCPLDSAPGMLNSFSSESTPGLVPLTSNASVLSHAELMVHESTHQYLHIARSLGPLLQGGDDALFYSPMRGEDRPLGAILAAHHAFGNILLFYRAAREAGVAGAEAALATEAEIWPQVDEIEKHLLTTRALTPLGRALVMPLAEQLAHCRESSSARGVA